MTQTRAHNLHILGVIPFASLQNYTETTVKRWKTMQTDTGTHLRFHYRTSSEHAAALCILL